jgi:hypothetical protein
VRRCRYCTEPLPAQARANRRYCDGDCRRQAHGRPAAAAGRRCEGCGERLPGGSRRNRRFCNEACQKAAARRRSRQPASTGGRAAARDRLAVVSAQLARTETALGQARGRVADRDRQLAGLRAQLAAERRSAARAIAGQANRTAGVRERLAAATGELSALRRNRSAVAGARVAAAEATGLREQLATVQGRYGQLAARYRELSEAAELAATERRQLQGVVRQWDTLCKRLYQATGGQPAAAVDRDILATWRRFRQAVATGTGHRGRAPVTGHPTGQATGQETGHADGQLARAGGVR